MEAEGSERKVEGEVEEQEEEGEEEGEEAARAEAAAAAAAAAEIKRNRIADLEANIQNCENAIEAAIGRDDFDTAEVQENLRQELVAAVARACRRARRDQHAKRG